MAGVAAAGDGRGEALISLLAPVYDADRRSSLTVATDASPYFSPEVEGRFKGMEGRLSEPNCVDETSYLPCGGGFPMTDYIPEVYPVEQMLARRIYDLTLDYEDVNGHEQVRAILLKSHS
jgi:hypothetical protein